ncbi:MAG: endonuclease/exonuclease/phosphatase [Filimonas sp.]|nr:endonuclease/exonuclease/phosphatase [Filimonas sp.]
MKKSHFLLLIALFSLHVSYAQQKSYKVANVAFYNLENFFDTLHQKGVNDFEFLPDGSKKYTGAVYWDKVKNLASVLRDIGTDVSPDGPAVMGVSEVENITVLQDLVNHAYIKGRGYKIVHYDSPDARGIDVGFLYNPRYFTVDTSYVLPVTLPADANGAVHKTRDVLLVKGKLDNEVFYFLVNHWPSRLGGEAASAPNRAIAAGVGRRAIDSILAKEPEANIMLMGDLNDNPTNTSITKVLQATGKIDKVGATELYNPWVDYYNRGIGTLAYQDAWALFDQIMLSKNILNKSTAAHFRFYKANIFKREDMIQSSGRYKGYPKRTYDFDSYISGFSDHFPTYITLIKALE